MIKWLTFKELKTLEMREQGYTLREVAETFGNTPETIRKIELKAKEKKARGLS